MVIFWKLKIRVNCEQNSIPYWVMPQGQGARHTTNRVVKHVQGGIIADELSGELEFVSVGIRIQLKALPLPVQYELSRLLLADRRGSTRYHLP